MGLSERLQDWLSWDQNPVTQQEIRSLQQADDVEELQKRLGSRIRFGTAGLRGRMQAGFAYMNHLTVIQTAQGLAKYLLQSDHETPPSKMLVLIGHDARHNSKEFARFAANAFFSTGFSVHLFEDCVPTPLVAFGMKHWHATAGIVITASHNPAQDNGFKVYGSNGAQIMDEAASAIAQQIALNEKPWEDAWTATHIVSMSNFKANLEKAYCQNLSQSQLYAPSTEVAQANPSVIYTPMHGVGWHLMNMVSQCLHGMELIPCLRQQHPDPDFPTVKFPNPEETGALALAIEEADKSGASLVLANDPDADRFAAACKMSSGEWHQFTGDQMGVLLADFLIHRRKDQNDDQKVALICTAVSSSMMSKIIKHAGERFHFEQTLTGFKWIGNRADELAKQGFQVLFGYEEALGYMFPNVSLDKDGVAAASLFLFAVKIWALEGLSPYQKLVELYGKYGWHDSINTYFTTPSPAVTTTLFEFIRTSEVLHTLGLGKLTVLRWRDVTNGRSSGHWAFKFTDQGSQMLTFAVRATESQGEATFTLRASGTEPKVKLYLEAVGTDSERAQRMSRIAFETIMRLWIQQSQAEVKHSTQVTSSLGQVISVQI